MSVHRGMLGLMADLDCQGGRENRYLHKHLFRGVGMRTIPTNFFALMKRFFQGEVGPAGPTGSPGKEGLMGAKVRECCISSLFFGCMK